MVCRKEIIALGLSLFIYSCAPDIKDVSGEYIDNRINSFDTLIIYPNYQYLHKARVNSILKTQKGKWSYKSGELTLSDYIIFDLNPNKSYIWSGEMEKKNGELHII
ncbi:MAG TPA: hypothetical protein VK671_16750, partial [Mucilaginibacter sp.]|nr:hypothetical protein [Mucilaginibacter sp.]